MIHIFGGGTVNFVRSHLALCAPAYGSTARALYSRLLAHGVPAAQLSLELTRMADPASRLETNANVAERLDTVLANPETKVIIFNVALCDYEGTVGDVPAGKYAKRLSSRAGRQTMVLTPSDKLLKRVRQGRPDIILVGFKTTAGDSETIQLAQAGRQISETQANWVLANDTVTRHNLLVQNQAGEATLQWSSEDRQASLEYLAHQLAAAYQPQASA